MRDEFLNVTIHGGWLVFSVLAAVWIAIMVERRMKNLGALLNQARRQAAEAQEEAEALRAELLSDPARTGLAELAARAESGGMLPARSPQDRQWAG